MKMQRTKQILIGLILILSFGLGNNSLMAQMNYFINSQGIPLNASATEAKQRLGNGEAYLGEIRAYPSNQNPSNWIKTDGRLLQINQYLALYGMLGNRFGGDNINTFAVPNLRGIDTNDSTNNTSWSIGGDRLRAIGLMGTLNNYDVSFVRNSVPQFTLNSGGIQSFVDYLTSGNVTLQKGNPRLRLRDTGSGGHTLGFDLHVNGDEFIIDDNTHSKNILRNYLNGSVHTTDFDAEVYNFKNGGSTYATLNSTGLGIGVNPTNKFHVLSPSSTVAIIESSASQAFYGLKSNTGGVVYFGNKNGGDFTIQTAGSAYSDKFYVTSGGNVGIGTISPSASLDVVGNIRMSSANPMRFEFNKLGGFYNWIESDGVVGNNFMRFGVANTEYLRILQNGNVGIGTINPSSGIHLNRTTGESRITVSSGNSQANVSFGGTFGQIENYVGDLFFSIASTTGDFIFRNNGYTEKFRITANGGVLLPRMTTTQINAIASPTNGLMVYNTTLNKLCVYENTTWKQVTTTNM